MGPEGEEELVALFPEGRGFGVRYSLAMGNGIVTIVFGGEGGPAVYVGGGALKDPAAVDRVLFLGTHSRELAAGLLRVHEELVACAEGMQARGAGPDAAPPADFRGALLRAAGGGAAAA